MARRESHDDDSGAARGGLPGFFGTLWRMTLVGVILFCAAAVAGYATVHKLVKTPEVQAPDLLTMSAGEALAAASEEGFSARIGDTEASEILQAGQVIAQRPEPGAWLKPGATILLTVVK